MKPWSEVDERIDALSGEVARLHEQGAAVLDAVPGVSSRQDEAVAVASGEAEKVPALLSILRQDGPRADRLRRAWRRRIFRRLLWATVWRVGRSLRRAAFRPFVWLLSRLNFWD